MRKVLALFLAIFLLINPIFFSKAYAAVQQISVESLLNVVDLTTNYATQIRFSASAASSLSNALLSPTVTDKVLINGRTIAEINAYQVGGVEAYWKDNSDGYFVLHLFIFKSLGSYGIQLNGYDSIKVLSGFTTAKGDVLSADIKYGCNFSGIWYPFVSRLSTASTNGTIDIATAQGRKITNLPPPRTQGDWEYRFGTSVIMNSDNSIEEWSSARGYDSWNNNYEEVGNPVAEHISGIDVVAQKFTARWAFDGLDVYAPSYDNNTGNLTLKLYLWNTDYSTTVSGTVISTATFVNFTDNSKLAINFDRIGAGEYLWTLSGGTENVGVYRYDGSNFSSNINFRNGSVSAGGDFMSRVLDSMDKYTANGTLTDVQITSGKAAAQKFVSNYPFDEVSVQCPSYGNNTGNLTLKLYAWNTDYATTISGTAIAYNTFTNFIDNSYLNITFTAQMPGSYLWVLSSTNVVEKVGVKKYSTSAVSGNVNYFNGSTTTGDYRSKLGICYWDRIKYKKSIDGGATWQTEMPVFKPTLGSKDTLSTCDPGVVSFGGYYYIGYTSTEDSRGTNNQLYVARSTSSTGPFEKWNGSGWGGNPQPFITYTGPADQFGIGEPSFVVKDNLLYIYYTYNTSTNNETRLATVSATNTNWPGAVTLNGVAIQRFDSTCDSTDVKYVDSINKFMAIGIYKRMDDAPALYVYESADGYTFNLAKNPIIYDYVQRYSHNIGVSGTPNGHFDTSKNNFVIASIGNWSAKPWDLYLTPISFYDSTNDFATDFVAINMQALGTAQINMMDTKHGEVKSKLQTALPTGQFNKNTISITYGDYNQDGIDDLYCVAKQGTGSGYTEVHILDGASNFQEWIAHAITPILLNGTNYEFIAADYNGDGYKDLYCINKNNNGQTTLQILNGITFGDFLIGSTPITIPYGATDVNWAFDVAKYDNDTIPDIVGICKMGGGGKTEVHILNGSTFNSFLEQRATVLGFTDENFEFKAKDFNRDGKLDICAIFKKGTSGKTELHILDGSSSYQTYAKNYTTPIEETNANWIFGMGNFSVDTTPPNIYGVDNNGLSGKTVISFNEGVGRLNGKEFTSGSMVCATGDYTLIVTDKAKNSTQCQFSVVIYGDVNGDGLIDVTDLAATKSHLLKVNSLSGIYKKAAGIFSQNNVTIIDLIAIKKHILGINPINN